MIASRARIWGRRRAVGVTIGPSRIRDVIVATADECDPDIGEILWLAGWTEDVVP